MAIQIVLVAPEIPQNTGSIGRLCVNLGLRLHLIEPLGFNLDEKSVRRAGLDYWAHLDHRVHKGWREFIDTESPDTLRFASTKAESLELYDVEFGSDDFLVFGREADGLPPDFYDLYREQLFRIPMTGEFQRSLNLSNAVAIVVDQAYRQLRWD